MLALAVLALGLFVIACIGIGTAVHEARPPAIDLAYAPLTGFAVVIWVSTTLDLLAQFHVALLAILLGFGLLSAGWRVRRMGGVTFDTLAPAALIVGAVALVVFLPPEFNLNDDGPAYLLFSEKLRWLGSSGAEPFSERRMYGLGGQFGIVALVSQTFGLRWLSLYEPGLGLALVGSVIALRSADRPAWSAIRLSLVLGVALLGIVACKPIANLAPALTYAAVLFGATLTWLGLFKAREGHLPPDIVLLALYCAAALTLRPTALPFIAMLALSGAFVVARKGDVRALGLAVLAAAIMLTPALLVSLRASGTAFYPILGHGVHTASTYLPTSPGEVFDLVARQGAAWASLIFTGLLAAGLALTRRAPPGAILLAVIATLAFITVAWATGGEQLSRYVFPILFAVVAALVTTAAASGDQRVPRPLSAPLSAPLPGHLSGLLAGAAAALVVALAVPSADAWVATNAPARLAGRWRRPVLSQAPGQSWRLAQSGIPRGAVLLSVGGSYTGLMDVRRNPILAADQPGTAGPAGGWPQDPVSPKSWLIRSGVDYVLIEHRLMAAVPDGDTTWRRGLTDAQRLVQRQIGAATEGVRPVHAGTDLSIYAVSDLNAP